VNNKQNNITERIEARVAKQQKKQLIVLAKEKGCIGITGLLKLLAKAKKVDIEI